MTTGRGGNGLRAWFYYRAEDGCNLRSLRKDVSYIAKPEISLDDPTTRARVQLLKRIAKKGNMRDLCEEYVVVALPPLRAVWPPLIIYDPTMKTTQVDSSAIQGNSLSSVVTILITMPP